MPIPLDRRASHNAVERQRRELLNTYFQELSSLIPSLQNSRKSSKSQIVVKAIEYIRLLEKRIEVQETSIRTLAQRSNSQEFPHQMPFSVTPQVSALSMALSDSPIENCPDTPNHIEEDEDLLSPMSGQQFMFNEFMTPSQDNLLMQEQFLERFSIDSAITHAMNAQMRTITETPANTPQFTHFKTQHSIPMAHSLPNF